MPNRLATSTSPYLLQHQDNPVDWFPWGPDALERSRKEDKPIFLSIGYSACHWCHVMAHESFENEALARQLNDSFVSIKVDREERPDLDHIYMAAVQAISGRGGWPMSVFLTPDGQPFFGGTYWPPERRMGMPGFDEVLRAVADLWHNRRPAAIEQAEQLTEHVRQTGNPAANAAESTGAMGSLPALARPEFTVQQLATAVAALERMFDFTYGGFGGAPKFPHAMDLQLLMRFYLREGRSGVLDMVRKTLDHMAGGGIYEHLGGGFHRYSVDRQWLVPHFEKMLYDNALLARTYTDAWRLTGDPEYASVVRGTLDYLLNEMQDEAGGFYSTQDADSEGVEGKFFVWTPGEIRAVLGDEIGERFCRVYDVTEEGNFEEHSILNLGKTLHQWAGLLDRPEDELRQEMADARNKLLAVRRQRIAPGLDNKVLVFWNALAIDALAEAAGALDEPRYLEAAHRAADFIWQQMRRDDGRLWHVWRGGKSHGEAFLDDYAGLIQALVTLYEASFREELIVRAVSLAEVLLTHFLDKTGGGGFFFTADDHEQLIARQKPLTDESVPSGNGLAATALLRLGRLTGRHDFVDAAIGTLAMAAPLMRDYPQATGQLLLALDFHLGPAYELVLVGDQKKAPTADVLAELRHQLLPPKGIACRDGAATAGRSAALDALFEGRTAIPENVTLLVCENYACQEPAVGLEACLAAIKRLTSSYPSSLGREAR